MDDVTILAGRAIHAEKEKTLKVGAEEDQDQILPVLETYVNGNIYCLVSSIFH